MQTKSTNPKRHLTQKQAQISKIISKSYNKGEKQLRLKHCLFQIDECREILHFRDWTRLRVLDISWFPLENGLTTAIGSLQWPNLETLALEDSKISLDSLRKLFSKHFPKLITLNLGNNLVRSDGMQELLLAENMPVLTKLNLDNNKILGSCLTFEKVFSKDLSKLSRISLHYNQIGPSGVKFFTKAILPNLQCLTLSYCHIGNQGAKHLTKSNWPLLSILALHQNKINYTGVYNIALASWPSLQVLKLCSLSDKCGIVAVSGLMISNWPIQASIFSQFDNSTRLRKTVGIFVESRYFLKEIKNEMNDYYYH